MAAQYTHRIALIGAGPRGTSVLERLIAHHRAASTPAVPLHIHVIDPFEPGSGHVWRRGQSRLFLMNTPALFPTVVPAADWAMPSPLGLAFDDWRRLVCDGGSVVDSGADSVADSGADSVAGSGAPGRDLDLAAEDRSELAALRPADFPSRALYGRYLRWVFGRLLDMADESVQVTVHRAEAVSVTPHVGHGTADGPGHGPGEGPADAGHERGWTVELAAGDTLTVDSAVLALGHLPAELREDQQDFVLAAETHGLTYRPPNVPADVDWDEVPAAEPVLIRGLGLNFFDVMIALTAGRGGRFVDTARGPGRALSYEPSGREPLIHAASRRGVPYRAKARLDSYIPAGVRLRFCTDERLAADKRPGFRPGFNHDIWPLLRRDVLWTYYRTLARTSPGAFAGHWRAGTGRNAVDDFLVELDAVLNADTEDLAEPWEQRVDRLVEAVIRPEVHLRFDRLAKPFDGRAFASQADFDSAVIRHLESDAAGAAAGEDDPEKMAIGALNAGRSAIKKAVADAGITDASWTGELRGWFEPFVEGLASGPPAQRIEQLAALARAGVVHFLGPDPRFRLDPTHRIFSGTSPWVDAAPVRARCLIEAMMPANQVSRNISPLLIQLLDDGLVRPKMMVAADDAPIPTSGLDVSEPPYRPITAKGRIGTGLYTLGLQLSSVQWGTAIAAEAGSDPEAGARTLKDADDIAADILARSAEPTSPALDSAGPGSPISHAGVSRG